MLHTEVRQLSHLSMFQRARRVAEGILGRGRSAVEPVDADVFLSLDTAVKEAPSEEPSEAKHRVRHTRERRSGMEIITITLPEVPSYRHFGPGIPIRLYRQMSEQVPGPGLEASVSERRVVSPRKPRSGRVPSRSRHASLDVPSSHYDTCMSVNRHMCECEQVHAPPPPRGERLGAKGCEPAPAMMMSQGVGSDVNMETGNPGSAGVSNNVLRDSDLDSSSVEHTVWELFHRFAGSALVSVLKGRVSGRSRHTFGERVCMCGVGVIRGSGLSGGLEACYMAAYALVRPLKLLSPCWHSGFAWHPGHCIAEVYTQR